MGRMLDAQPNFVRTIKEAKRKFEREMDIRRSDYLFNLSQQLNLPEEEVWKVWKEV